MKILVSSHAFAPSIGGIETVSALLAAEFVRLGHSIKVLTQTPTDRPDEADYEILRRPSLKELVGAIRWCDLFWQNNLSLRTLWPAWMMRKPVVITHQGSYCRQPQRVDLVQRLKHAIVRRTRSIAISQAVADSFATDSAIISNPYDARQFAATEAPVERDKDLVFLGRLVSEKGLDLLLEALASLHATGVQPSLTVIGAGPELTKLQETTTQLGLNEQVCFVGPKRGSYLVALLRRHKILVAPSRYDEPFGVVALEGIAAGCAVVGSEGGGLPEAIGPCGLTFPNGDVAALAGKLRSLLESPNEQERLRSFASTHLARFHPATIAESYLQLFQDELA